MRASLRLGVFLVLMPVLVWACRMAPITAVTLSESARLPSPLAPSPVPIMSTSPSPQDPTPSPSSSPLLPQTPPFYQPVEALKPTPTPSASASVAASGPPVSPSIPSASPSVLPSVLVSMTPGPVPTQASAQGFVRIRNFSFEPSVVTIRQGGSVVFINDDDVSHSVVADAGVFTPTGVIQPQGFKTVTLAQIGIFGYRCDIYVGMTGQIQVVP